MTVVLDGFALLAVAAAAAFLIRKARQSRCGGCGAAKAAGETVIALAQLRASARRAAGRR